MLTALVLLALVVLIIVMAFAAQSRDLATAARPPVPPASAPAEVQTPPSAPDLVVPSELGPGRPNTTTTRIAIPRPTPPAPPAQAQRPAQEAPRPVPRAATQTPLRPTPRAAAQSPRPTPQAPLPLLAEANALLGPTFRAIDALPAQLNERVAMRAEAMAVEYRLHELQRTLQNKGQVIESTIAAEAIRLGNKLKQLAASTVLVANDLQTLAAQSARLHREAAALPQALHDLAEQLLLPITWGTTSAMQRAVLRAAEHESSLKTEVSHDEIKRRLRRVQSLLRDLEEGEARVQQIRQQREALLALLATPELAERPTWHRSIAQLAERARAKGALPEALVALHHDADQLLAQRATLLAAYPTSPQGSPCIAEDQLADLLEKAQTMRQDVQALWARARAVVQPPT